MEAAAGAAAVGQQSVSAQVVGNAFVQQYYHILHHSPELVFRFYQDISKLGRPEDDGSMSITTTMQAINDKILSLNYGDFRVEIKSVDSQESFDGGVLVLVTGYLNGEDNLIQNFSQTFFLAPQDRGYFVLNDMFRYVEFVNEHDAAQVPATDVVAPEQDLPPVQQIHISDQHTPSVEEANEGEVYSPHENGDVPVEEEVPVAEVVDEMHDDSQMVVESNTKIEDAPKKSYASIVMHLKGTAASFSPPQAPASRNPMAKGVEQVNQPPITATDRPASSSNSVDNANNQEGEATDGYSIYIKGLPPTATVALLADEFKKFGSIKKGGIQVKNNRVLQQGFSYGFVEFEEASAMQEAVEASPILIGGRQAVVEEKKSTNSRGNNFRGRFPSGGVSGYRNYGVRGRGSYGGNYGGGRGYARDDFGGRTEFNNRGGYRGWSANRGGDGYQSYQRTDNPGGYVARTSRGGGMPNGTARHTTPHAPEM